MSRPQHARQDRHSTGLGVAFALLAWPLAVALVLAVTALPGLWER